MTFLEAIEAEHERQETAKREAFQRLVELVGLTRRFTDDQHAAAAIEVSPDQFLTDLEATGRSLDDLMIALAHKGS
ncbi:MAG: hypothetical protein U0941_29805 [Planctomycetaceae bacterium]